MFLIVPNLIDLKMCSSLIDTHQKNINLVRKWRNTHPLLCKPSKEIENIFTRFFPHQYVQRMEIVKWPTNSFQAKHYDEDQIGGDSSGLASITYLNDDYEGGQTCIVDEKLCVNPKIGTTFFFDGKKYEHEVKPITDGIRYTLALWYSNDPNCRMDNHVNVDRHCGVYSV